ncbi:MAG TPA: hypothetical protein VE546_13240 [Streptomyces sp.]|uniref:hypothetical protein n=1 Tax=Streptomyces sp. TaxID=1931 RepID=UPI002D73F217|nr:hypothetical protein [Streptomyces sp.]HZG04517.1 hypothetical protein [Streptomyces sp.]
MDVETALALASAAAGGAATEAGRHAWESLVALVRRATGRGGAEDPAVPDGADGTEDPEAVTGRIVHLARTDEDFADRLCRWAETHRAALRIDGGQVHNTVSGSATVHGPVVQTGEIHGGITFN